jgi:hypothetical protein
MDITVMTKKRYEQLISDIKNLETQIAMANNQLRAIQDSNNQLAEIAFDENKFTQQLMDRVDEVAREAAKDAVDMDDITSEVQDNIDISEDVQRCVDRMDLIDADKVNDMIEEYVNDNNLLNTDEVESVVEDFLHNNDYITRDDVEDVVRDVVAGLKEEIVLEVLQLIANKLTGKDKQEEVIVPLTNGANHAQHIV